MIVDAVSVDGSELRLVIRMGPAGEGLFPDYNLSRQCALLRALAKTPVPVPRLRWYEPGSAVLGAPFYVMDHVEGRIPGDSPPFTLAGWFLDLGPSDRRRLLDGSLGTLAAIHAVDRAAIGIPDLGADQPPGQPLRDQLRYYQDYFRWGCGGHEVRGVPEAFAWAWRNAPVENETVLSWGDARLANMIFGADLRVHAVLDWEMVGLGSRALDLGWWLFFLRYHTDGIGVAAPAGIPDRRELIATYERFAGRPVRHVHYYEVFAALRSAVIQTRAVRLRVERGVLGPEATPEQHSPAVHLLADLLGLPAPSPHRPGYVRLT
jgi:aminoglycoside phosphotransferase (APT) family kinase protein